MDNYTNITSVLIAGICTILSWFFGNFDGAIQILLACVIVDYITGIAAAIVQEKFETRICCKGIGRKVIMFALVGVTQITGRELFGNAALLRNTVIYFYVASEGLSIIRNADKAGVPVPKILIRGFSNLKEKEEEKAL
ncbi:MAG: phage holin family protein [Synergistaceae bacterium]|nr:phage holin family protein [Synergistaceae bacterium]